MAAGETDREMAELTLAHGAAIAGRMDDGRIGSVAAEGRADDRIADDFAALAGAHHAAVVFGRPGAPVFVEFAFVETAGRCHGDLVVVVLRPVEHVALDTGKGSLGRISSRSAHADGQTRAGHLDVSQPTLKLGAGRAGADDGRFRQFEVSDSGIHAGQRELVEVSDRVFHLVSGEFFQQPDVGHEGDLPVIWSGSSARLAPVHQHDPSAFLLLDADPRYVDQFQDGQTAGHFSGPAATSAASAAGDGHVVVEVALVVDVNPAKSRPIGSRSVANRIE